MVDAPNTYERIRAFVEGTLDADAALAVERQAAEDPSFAEALASYRAAHEATAGEPLDRPTLTFDALASQCMSEGRRRTLLWLSGAAAVLLIGLGVFAWGPSGGDGAERGPRSVVLQAISLTPPPAPEAAPVPLPAMLATYAPVHDGTIAWLDDLDTAKRISEFTGRPLLIYEVVHECPYCEAMERTTLRDAEVLVLAAKTVPVRIDLVSDTQRLLEHYNAGQWPYFEVRRPPETVGAVFGGPKRADAFRPALQTALATRAGEPLGWAEVRTFAQRHATATEAEAAGRFGAAYTAYLATANSEAAGSFARHARQGLSRLRSRAREALLRARARAEDGDAPGAQKAVSAALAAFAGTPMEADFQAVLTALEKTRAFPLLVSKE